MPGEKTKLSIAVEENTGITLCIIVMMMTNPTTIGYDCTSALVVILGFLSHSTMPVMSCVHVFPLLRQNPGAVFQKDITCPHMTPVSMPVSCRVPPVASQVPQSFPNQYVWDQPRHQLWPSGDLLHLATTVDQLDAGEKTTAVSLWINTCIQAWGDATLYWHGTSSVTLLPSLLTI